MSTRIEVKSPPGLRRMLDRLASVPADVRAAMERALAEELISLEEDLRGPTPGSPGTGDPSGPHPLSDGPGLVPVNTGRLLQSFQAIPRGLSAVMTADAQDPRSGFFYAEVAHHSGGDDGDTVLLVTDRWNVMADRAAKRMEEVLTDHLRGGA